MFILDCIRIETNGRLSFYFKQVMNSMSQIQIPIFEPRLEINGIDYQNMSLRLHEHNGMQWWELKEECNDTSYEKILSKLPYAKCEQHSVLYTFNEKLYPSSLSPYIGGG